MNVFTLLTNWCSRDSKPVLTREEVGVVSNFTSRQSRLDSLSLVSRQSDLATYVGRVVTVLVMMLCLGVGNAWGTDETITFSSCSSSSSGSDATKTITWTCGTSCNILQEKGTTNTNVGNYTTAPRWYQNHLITFTPKNGATITKVVITAGESKNGQPMSFSSGSGTVTNTSTTVTTISGSWASAFTLKMGTQCRPSTVKVTYTAGCTGTKLGTPVVTATPTSGQVVLTWPAVSNASSYQLKWNGGEWESATSGVTKTGLTDGTTYTYQVKAIGNSSTYCDGDASTSASVIPGTYYTVTWMSNGSSYTTTSVRSGTKPTFPDAPSSCDGTSTTFYGWAATGSTWSGKIDDISAKTIYTSASDMPNVSGAVTYHAVFAKATGSGTTTQAATLSTSAPIISGSGWATSTSKTYSGPYLRLDVDGQYVSFTSPKGAISRFQFTYKLNYSTSCSGHSTVNWWIGDVKFYVSTDGGSNWTELTSKSINDIDRGTNLGTDIAVDYTDLASGCYNAIKVQLGKNCGNLGIKGLSATYSNATYSEYLTSCCTPLASINGSILGRNL